MRFVETILTLIGILLMLGGCSATGVTMMPMTMIGALIVGGLFLLYPVTRPLWRLFAGGYLVTVIVSTAMLLIVWTMHLGRDYDLLSIAFGAVVPLIALGLVAPTLCAVALVLSAADTNQRLRRFGCVTLQVLSVVAGWAYSTNFFRLFSA